MSAEVKLVALEVGDALWAMVKQSANTVVDGGKWVGGVLQGEFNTKATFGQIVTDAVISMFPILGEVTAARDSIAITIRMCNEPGAAKDKWEWVSLVCCLLALVPVLGGLLKGVGRLIVEAAKSSKNAVEIIEELLKFLNKMGVGDARKWLKELKILQYQTTVLNSFHELIGRIKAACAFLSTKMGAALPKNIHLALKALSEKLDQLQKLGDKMIPEAFTEFHGQLKIIQEAMHDGSYIAPIRVGAKESRVMVPEGKILVEKTIQGSMQHPPASLANYTHKKDWPDLKKIGEKKLPDPVEKKEMRDQMIKAGDYWPINTFSRNAPIVAHVGKPGDPLVRILDKAKYKETWHQAGDMWGDVLPPNGHWFRIKLAVKHAWNANGYYEKLIIPTRAQMEALGIHVPHDWDGMRLWKGTVGGQLDNDAALNGFKASNDWLEGGGTQLYIDFSNEHNAPVKDYLLKTVQTFETGWKDLQLPMGKAAEHKVVNLEALQRSAKIQEEGYLLRGAATAGKQSNNPSQPKN